MTRSSLTYAERCQLRELGFVRQRDDGAADQDAEYVRYAIQACIGTVKQLGGGRSVPMRFNKYRDVIQALESVIEDNVPDPALHAKSAQPEKQ